MLYVALEPAYCTMLLIDYGSALVLTHYVLLGPGQGNHSNKIITITRKTRATLPRPCASRRTCRGHPLSVPFCWQINNKKMFDLGNKGQHSQWYHSMANIDLCKSRDAFLR